MSIGRILFFIFMPLVYKGLEIVFTEEDYKYNFYYISQALQLVFYYGIELFFIVAQHKITKEWMFTKERIYSDAYISFVVFAIIFIFISFVFCLDVCRDYELVEYDIGKIVLLIICFGIYIIFADSYVDFNMTEKIYAEMPYEITSQETIELRAFSDTHTTSGKIRGGRFYINGEIRDNYELYYCFMAEDGSLTIRHFTYTEAHCKIFPEENCPNPRIEITTYGKSYKDKANYYSDYVLHIPDDNVIGTGIDME